MRLGNLLFSLINLLFAALLVVFGIFVFMIPRAPHFKEMAITLFKDSSSVLTVFGLGLSVIGLLLLAAIYFANRRNYYHITMGGHRFSIDEVVLHKYLASYWKSLFPAVELHHELAIRNNQIYLNVELPHLSIEEQKKTLQKIEKDLQKLFIEVFDYEEEFFVTVSFQKA